MSFEQPKPYSKGYAYADLINDVEKGIIKIPKFQRDFVWSIDKTAKLLDSILKGYPIGTFILWQTGEQLNHIKNVGNLDIPDTPDGVKVQYVLDGQQRITSLFAAYRGAKLKNIDCSNIVVNLDADINDNDEQVITEKSSCDNFISLSDVLNFMGRMTDIKASFSDADFKKIDSYSRAFDTYIFSIVILRKEDIDSAIEVFTRINTGGQTLTLFEIMSAKTYDEQKNFDMQVKWNDFTKELKEIKYEGVSSSVVFSLLALLLSRTKECKRKTILELDKQSIIGKWDSVISALKSSIDYFRTTYRISVSQLLPCDFLLVPFAYFFHRNKDKPNADQRKYLEEFFWSMSLSSRYSSSTESKLAQDIKRIDEILEGRCPEYNDIKVNLDSHQSEKCQELISAGESDNVEFKSTLRYDVPNKKVNKKLEYAIVKAIAAFLNSDGGNVFIGVDDNQNILGLQNDISRLSKKNPDGFELCLIEIVKKYIDVDLMMSHIKINYPTVENILICHIKVSKSSRPVFIKCEGKDDFFVRIGRSSRPLSHEDQSAYEKSHWGNK